MTDKRWKNTERAIANILNGVRVPINGREGVDVKHPTLALEVKDRERLPNWLHDAMSQAKASCEDGQTPCVVLHESGMPHAQNYCVFRLGDVAEAVEGA